MLNQWLMDWFDLHSAPINLVSIVGMGFVQGFGLAGLVFVFTTTSLRSMDGSLEEAAVIRTDRLPDGCPLVVLILDLDL